MVQRKPKDSVTLGQMLKLVEQLLPEEQAQLRQKLDQAWGDRWDSLLAKIEERNRGLAQLTEEEIYAEFTEHRREQKAKRAQSCD